MSLSVVLESGVLSMSQEKEFSETCMGERVAFICVEFNPEFPRPHLPVAHQGPCPRCLSRAGMKADTQSFHSSLHSPAPGYLGLCSQLQSSACGVCMVHVAVEGTRGSRSQAKATRGECCCLGIVYSQIP